MNNWNKLLIYEVTEHAACSINSAKYRIEVYQKEGNILDETISPDIVAEKVKIFFEEWLEKEENQKQEKKKFVSKRRKERWDDLLDELDKAPRKKYPDLSLEYQLGHYIGDYIVEKFLPTLSVEGSTHTIIEVSKEETSEYERLNELWWNAKTQTNQTWNNEDSASKEWNHYRAYIDMLRGKYLPKTLECHIPRLSSVSEEKMDELKRGIMNAIWNSDVSNYSCSNLSDIELVLEDDCFFSVVNLKLAID